MSELGDAYNIKLIMQILKSMFRKLNVIIVLLRNDSVEVFIDYHRNCELEKIQCYITLVQILRVDHFI